MFRAGLPEDWPTVLRGIESISKRCGFIDPEVILEKLRSNDAGLFVCDDGFVLLEIDADKMTREQFLNVWLAHFKPGVAKKRRRAFIAWLDEKTVETNCKWWQFTSPRKGWVGIQPDCEVALITWRRKK